MSPCGDGVSRSMSDSDKLVKFCLQCSFENKCEECDKTFQMKTSMETTLFHQFKSDITCWVSASSTDMIADIGCPNSVIGVKDESIFKKSLSQFQQERLRILKVDEKFKFGPSGPYRSERKLIFPIFDGSKDIHGEVSVVMADIPMLLGNNILKPLGASIHLFETGNGANIPKVAKCPKHNHFQFRNFSKRHLF